MNRTYVEVWRESSATHVLRTHRSQNKVLGIGVFLILFFCKLLVYIIYGIGFFVQGGTQEFPCFPINRELNTAFAEVPPVLASTTHLSKIYEFECYTLTEAYVSHKCLSLEVSNPTFHKHLHVAFLSSTFGP